MTYTTFLRNLLKKILVVRKRATSSYVSPLQVNLAKVKVAEPKPFVSIHVAVYNEKRVVERLIRACTSQEWSSDLRLDARSLKLDTETGGSKLDNQASSIQSQDPTSSFQRQASKANYEVVIVDDSTDETTEIAKQALVSGGWKISGSVSQWVSGTSESVNQQSESPNHRVTGSLKHRDTESPNTNEEIFIFTPLRQGSEGQAKPVVKLIHRNSRAGFKGGALQVALENTEAHADYIVVLDADFVPYADTIEQFVKTFQVLNANDMRMEIPRMDANEPISINSQNYNSQVNSHVIAAVQGYQWHVLNKSQTWVTRGVRTEYAGSYVIERSSSEIYGGLKQIAGSVYCIRADVLRQFGWGTSITEDFELTLRLYEAGYKVAFTPYIQVPAEAVSTIKRLIRQRMRWAEGASFNVKIMLSRILFGRWVDKVDPESDVNDQFLISNYSNQVPNPNDQNFQNSNISASLGQLEIRSIRNSEKEGKVWVPSPLSLSEKLEFLYLAPYYLQAAFFIVGTSAWFISETVFGARLPFWTAAFGWSLVFTNLLALPLMNIVGLFLEESDERDYVGILSFVALSYIVVPFQAYAVIKGFLESSEGPWFRTPKTGLITDVFGRSGFGKFFGQLLGPKAATAASNSFTSSVSVNTPGVKDSYTPGVSLQFIHTGCERLLHTRCVPSGRALGAIRPKRLRLVGRSVLVALLIFAISLNLVSFNQNGFFEKVGQQYVGDDKKIEIVGKDIFKADEKPQFNLKIPKDKETRLSALIRKALTLGEAQAAVPTVSASLVDAKGEVKDVSGNLSGDNDNFKLALAASDQFKPGKYTLKVEVKDAKGKFVASAQQDFRWGVLAINVNKSIYTPGETVKLGIGMVDDVGKTVCSAKLTLDIKKPDLQVDTLSSEQDQIQQSGQCGGSSVTNVADNLAEYQVKGLGTYGLYLKAVTENGPREIEDQFEVRESVPFDIERTSYPTRIYPPAPYPVKLTIVANQDFEGKVEETVPASFTISTSEEPLHLEGVKAHLRGGFEVKEIENCSNENSLKIKNCKLKIITWDVNWKRGSTHTLGYTIKFPRESPQFYLVGPLRFYYLGVLEDVDGDTNQEGKEQNFTNDSNQSVIHNQPFLTKLQPSSQNNPVPNPFNNNTTGLYVSNGTNSAAQNTPNVICDAATSTCDQYLRSSEETLRATSQLSNVTGHVSSVNAANSSTPVHPNSNVQNKNDQNVSNFDIRASDLRSGENAVFEEARMWQIAADVVATKFMETPDATQAKEFWTSTTGTIDYDTAQKKSGLASWKADSGAGNAAASLSKKGVLADAGRRITFYVRFTNLPASTVPIFKALDTLGGRTVVGIQVTSGGVLQLVSGTTQIGTNGSTLSTGIWYRLSFAYTITSSTVNEFRLFLDGTLDISVSNAALSDGTAGDIARYGWTIAPGASKVLNLQHVYIDDSTALTDTGDMRVTAKLPTAVVHNNFDTTTNTGAVNERPISSVNRKAQLGTLQVHQDYDIQTAAGGDVDLTGLTIVALDFWVWASRGAGGAGGTPALIYQADTAQVITLGTIFVLFNKIVDTATYPSAGASVIGLVSSGTGNDTFFAEGGVLVASLGDPVPELALLLGPLAFAAPKIIKSIQKGTLGEDTLNLLRRVMGGVSKLLNGYMVRLLWRARVVVRRKRKRKNGG